MLIIPDNNLIPTSSGATIYVPTDYPTIQDAIDAANDGDTVFVYSWTYYEMVVINKTINLTGENRETTIIVGGYGEAIRIEANWVNISGFTTNHGIIGIYLNQSSNCNISDCTITDVNPMDDTGAIHLYSSDYNTITNCNVLNNGAHGIYIDYASDHNIITNCNASWNGHTGIRVVRGKNITIAHCNALSNGYNGIRLSVSPNGRIIDTNASSNNFHGLELDSGSIRNIITHCKFFYNGFDGIELSGDDFNLIEHCDISSNSYGIQAFFASDNIIENCNILSNEYGVGSYSHSNNKFINSTILHSTYQDFYLEVSHVTTLNTTFNKTKVFYNDPSSNLTVKWFLHVKVQVSGVGVDGANVTVSNLFGDPDPPAGQPFKTKNGGWARWIPVTEFIEDQSGRAYYTPHNITAIKGGQTGYAEPFMDISKFVIVDLMSGPAPTPPPPSGLSLALSSDDLNLTWYPSLDDGGGEGDVIGYTVYRAESVYGPYTNVSFINATGSPFYSWTDSGLGDGEWNNYFYIVRAKDADGLEDGNNNKVGKCVSYLEERWNLISVPLVQSNTTREEVLQTLEKNYSAVMGYHAGKSRPWKHWHRNKPNYFNDVIEINHKEGYYIDMIAPDHLVMVGKVTPQVEINLKSGWNLVGYPCLIEQTRDDALSSITGKYNIVEYYDPLTDKEVRLGSNDYMYPGLGYWIHATENCVLTFTN